MVASTLTSDALWQKHPDAEAWAGYLQLATDAFDSCGGFAALSDTDTDSNRLSTLPDGWRSYLVRHPQEDPAKYAWRVRNAVFPPLPRLVCETLTSFLFGQGPTRDGSASELTDWAEDADGAGSDLDTVLRRLAIHGQIFPFGLVMVGAPAAQFATQADADAAGWTPWLDVIHPAMLFDWRRSHDGVWQSVKLVDKQVDGGIADKRVEWTRARIYEVDDGGAVWLTTYRQDKEGKEATQVGEPLRLAVPEIPLVLVSFAETVVPDALSGAAPLQQVIQDSKGLYNDLSLLHEHIAAQCFALLVYQEDSAKQTPPLTVGASNALKYPLNVNAPSFIAPPDTVAATLFRQIEERIRRIYRMARLEFVLNDANSAPASGVSRAYEFQTTNRALGGMARTMADVERKIAWHVAAFNGKDADSFLTGYQVSWPTDFDLRDLEAEIRRTQEAMLLPFDSITKAAMLRSLRDDLVDLDPDEKRQSDEELDANAERDAEPPPEPPATPPPIMVQAQPQKADEAQTPPVE